jgi:hypothetical protein
MIALVAGPIQARIDVGARTCAAELDGRGARAAA